jgi:hypothetical protein
VLWECFFNGDDETRVAAAPQIPALLLAWSVRFAYAAPAAALDAVLTALYGALARDRQGQALLLVAPQLTEPSVYHSPALPPGHRAALTADALARHDRSVKHKAIVVDEPLEPLADGAAESRARVARAALRTFADRQSLLPPHALASFAQIAHRLIASGFAFDPDARPASAAAALELRHALAAPGGSRKADAAGGVSRKRLHFSSSFLSLLLHSLVFCLDTPIARGPALAAITALQQRATVELIPQVLVATSALASVTAAAASSGVVAGATGHPVTAP